MRTRLSTTILALSVAFFGAAPTLLADTTHNPPMVCAAKASCSSCPTKDGCACGCILVTLDLGSTTVWTGQTPVYLRIHSSDETASLSTPAQLKVVMGWSFKAVDGGTTAGGAPQIVRFVQPEGAELVVHFQDGDAVGVPEPNNLGKSLARVQMVDAEGWATTSAPAYYDLYPGDGSVWRFLATGNTNERGALVSFTDPRGRVLTPDDFGVDIVRDALGNIRQVKTLTRLADVRTLSPTHYAVTVYPLAEEPEQVADTGLYALPEHAPTRVLDVAQGESVKELLVGFQKGTGDMRQYRYVAVNGDWTLHQPSGLVEAQELYFTEDESGAQRLHTIRDETGKLWSRDEYNYVSAYWGYLITNRIEGIPGDATRTTSWSYYTDGPHKDLLRETVEPTGNRIVYEYDAQNRVVRESMPLVEEETLYSYEPVDPSDPVLLRDIRPRCIVKKMQGIEIQRTYYVYGTNGVDVVERVGEQGAAYGGTNVLRTVTTYYPVTGSVTDGLVKSVRHEDGTIDNYAYDLADGVWTETITHVHEQAPDIVPMRTTRSVRVYNALGQLVDSRTDLCTIGVEDLIPQADWTPIERLQYAYDIDGNEIRREDLAGRIWTAEWAGNCCGKASASRWDGTTTTYAFNAEGSITMETVHGVAPITTVFEYDAINRVIRTYSTNYVANLGTFPIVAEYDSLNRLRWISDAQGNQTMTSYSSDELETTTNYPDGTKESTLANLNGTASRIVSIDGAVDEYVYSVRENGIRDCQVFAVEQQSNGCLKEIVSLDMFGRTVCRVQPGMDDSSVRSCYTYDGYGRLSTTRTDGSPDEIHIYDISGNNYILKQTDGTVWRTTKTRFDYVIDSGFIWNKRGTTIACSDVRIQPITYSSAEKLTGKTLSDFNHFRFVDRRGNESESWSEYDAATGLVISWESSVSSSVPKRTISKADRVFATISSSYVTNAFSFDGLGRLSMTVDGRGLRTARSYHISGGVESYHDAAGGTTRFDYDSLGRLSSTTDPNGNVQVREYDSAGHSVYRGGSSYPVREAFDARGRRVSRTTYQNESDGIGQTASWNYDNSTGLLLSSRDARGNERQIFYDRWLMVSNILLKTGKSISIEHDRWGRETSRQYSDGTPSVYKEYDALGRLVHVIDGFADTMLEYDEFGALVSEIERGISFTNVILHAYSPVGKIKGLFVNGETNFLCSLNLETGRIADCFAFGNDERFEFRYIPGSDLPAALFYPNGVMKSFEYPENRNLPARIEYSMGTNILQRHDFLYDIGGRVVETSTTGHRRDEPTVLRCSYNSRSELTNSTLQKGTNVLEFSYSYDDIGNRTVSSGPSGAMGYSANELNQYVFISNSVPDEWWGRPTFDEEGNQRSVMTESGIWSVAYDGNNLPVIWQSGETNLVMRYDYRNRRRLVTKYISGEIVEIRRFVYDDNHIVREEFSGGTAHYVNSYVWDPSRGVDAVPIACKTDYSTNSVIRYYLHDNNKNITAIVSMSGEIETAIDYEPFGRRLIRGIGSSAIHFGFSSEYFESDLALVSFKYRFYDPRCGRWLSSDQSEPTEDLNAYAFVRNEPMAHYDRLGLDTQPKEMEENSPDSLEDGECLVHICCKQAAPFVPHGHCVIRFTKKDKSEVGCRGGPFAGGSNGSSGSSGSGSGGSSGSGNGSSSNGSFSGSSSGGSSGGSSSGGGIGQSKDCSGCCGSWGNVVAGCGKENGDREPPSLQRGINDDLEKAKDPDTCIFVKKIKNCEEVIRKMNKEMDRITQSCYKYAPLGNNSNTAWKTAFRNTFEDSVVDPPGRQPGNDSFDDTESCKIGEVK